MFLALLFACGNDTPAPSPPPAENSEVANICLLYTSDAADE